MLLVTDDGYDALFASISDLTNENTAEHRAAVEQAVKIALAAGTLDNDLHRLRDQGPFAQREPARKIIGRLQLEHECL